MAYASRQLSKAKKNYRINDKEGLAIIFGMKHYCLYLHDLKFTIETDHAPLRALTKSRDLTSRLVQWTLILQSYDYEIIHKLGYLHRNINALTCSEPTTLEPYNLMSDLLHHCALGTGPWIISRYWWKI